MWTLAQAGVITSFSDIWTHANAAFKAVNSKVLKEKRDRAKMTETFDKMIHLNNIKEDGELTEIVLYVRNADNFINKLEMDDITKEIAAYIAEHAGKRQDKRVIVQVFQLYYIEKHTQDTVSKRVKRVQSVVHDYIDTIERIIETADFRQFLADLIQN